MYLKNLLKNKVFIILLVLTGVGLLFFNASPNFLNKKVDEEYLRVKNLVKEEGVKAAYTYADTKKGREFQHINFLVGKNLFEMENPDGISRCLTNPFSPNSFGCVFAFQVEMVRDGAEYKDLVGNCKDNFPEEDPRKTCFHIIGHTIGSLEGYNLEALKETYNICEDVAETNVQFESCFDGASMEFTFARFGPDGESDIPKLVYDPDNPFYPCNEIVGVHPLCYYKVPEFWVKGAGLTINEAFDICPALQNPILKTYCYQGAALENYDVALDNSFGEEGVEAARQEARITCNSLEDTQARNICVETIESREAYAPNSLMENFHIENPKNE